MFRSDTEASPEAPRYEPIRPESGPWRLIKRLVAPLAAVGLLLAKFKFLLFALLKIKFVGTALTMLVSIGAYALLFPVWFAVGFVVLIWVHEMGHVLQLKREGIKASAPMFIPFLGAFVAMKEMPKNALAEARVGLAGPVLGTLGGLAVLGLYAWTQNPLFLGLAYFNFLINLFNLAPMLPLDGGRAMGAMSPVFSLLGLVVMVGMFSGCPWCGIVGRRATRRRDGRTTTSRRGVARWWESRTWGLSCYSGFSWQPRSFPTPLRYSARSCGRSSIRARAASGRRAWRRRRR